MTPAGNSLHLSSRLISSFVSTNARGRKGYRDGRRPSSLSGMPRLKGRPLAHAIDHAHERTRTGGEQMILILGLVRPLLFAV